MSELAVHLFPMLADDELEELAADIKGLLQRIVLDAEGRVLDGRNRLAACEIAGVEP
jgi:ParB-like chromosome segregation protein Spo0J